MKKNEKWVSGLSDCCHAPLKEIGEGITILLCSECNQMCNKDHHDNEDDEDFPEDFFDNE